MNIPSGWQNKPLGSVILDIGDGGTPNTNKSEYFGGAVPWVVIQDIKKHITSTKTTLTELGLNSCSAKLWPVGTVILSTGATIGEVGITAVPLATKQGIHGIVCSDDLSSEFLYYKLSTLRNFLKVNAQGSTIREVRAPFIRTIPIAFPNDKSEQEKITEVLSTLDRAIEQTEALIAKQQRIKTGLMQDLLTKGIDEHGNIRSEATHAFKESPLGRIPVEWEASVIEEVAKITTGDKDTQDRDDSAQYSFFVRSQTIERIDSYSFDGEAILTAGDGVGVGKVFHYFVGKFDYHQRVYCIHSFSEHIAGYFLFLIFRQNFMSRVAQFSAKGSVDSVRREMIAKMPIPLPSIEEQQKIGNILKNSEDVQADEERALGKLQLLKSGLMHDLLTGKHRVTTLLAQAMTQ